MTTTQTSLALAAFVRCQHSIRLGNFGKTVRRCLSMCRRERLVFSHIHLVKSLQPHPTVSIKPLDRPLDHWTDHWTIGPSIGQLDQPLDHWTDHWTIGPTIGPFDRPLHHWIHHWNIGPTIRPSDRAFDHWTNQDLWPTIGRLDQPLDHWIDHWTTGQNIEPIEQNHRNFDLEIMQSIIIKRSQLLVPRPIEHRIACPIDPAFVHYLQIRCKPNKWKTHRKHRS